jgi:hypothetical protein
VKRAPSSLLFGIAVNPTPATMVVVGLLACVSLRAQQPPTKAPGWAGVWKGLLTNEPATPGAAAVDVTMELGSFPSADGDCATWRTTYSEGGVVRQVKDYKLCRGTGADDLYLDEGGVKLTTRWVGDVLITPFKIDNVLVVASVRLSGDVLEEEILTIDDKPPAPGMQALWPRGMQRLILHRVVS